MKYRNKNYIRVVNLPFVLFPVIALTIGATLYCKQPKVPKPSVLTYEPDITRFSPVADKLKLYESGLLQETDSYDKALFNFTGDSVLVFRGPDFKQIPGNFRKILYQDKQGGLKTIDVPFDELSFPADSTDIEDE